MSEQTKAIRRPAEHRYAAELARLEADDAASPRPAGWRLSPRAVRKFLLGDAKLNITRKFYGDDPLADRAIVSLMSQQGLMLVGEPGTAKSLLSELLAAAVCGTSALVVQGSAGTTEDHIRYGWNYALLLAEGPSERALVPSPVLNAMRSGRIVRFEEITRCPPEVQDALISILSEKALALPELGPDAVAMAAPGFNVIATANLRDRGVHEISSALKRRFNFETVHPISDPDFERELVLKQLAERLEPAGVLVRGERDVADLLVRTFQDLRTGRTAEGVNLNRPDAVMSTAEAVNVLHAAALEAAYLDDGRLSGVHVARQIQGVVLKDSPEDGKRLRAYIDHIVKERAGRSGVWKEFYSAARSLKLG
ncbi:AAA family ATPase [Novosphingobium sp. SG707]|uniref:ATP-binding protein n=1 Tax=Novosphingobium sp. SG707 TaxID=2586996 RepID=UPI0014475CDA|nr:AAA family ATPase [Novosphingobium sp. SG707]NKJ00409.1 MoxR-like ATPase [Novosphingobium sp. SG707]